MGACGQKFGWFYAVAMVLLVGGYCLVGPAAGQPLKTDSRSRYVHRISLYDHEGKVIKPGDTVPYSPARTCGKCHAYETVEWGHHFNAGTEEARDGRAGEPWILVDAKAGTQVAVSYRSWPGVIKPGQAGLTRWGFVQKFARQSPGGGMMDPKPEELAKDPQAARWKLSGGLQIDCMICHDASDSYDLNEREHQLERQNYRWAPTAAMGLGAVNGEARKLPDDFDPELEGGGGNPDRPDLAWPTVRYDKSRFDAQDRVFFDIRRDPDASRCYGCHSEKPLDGTPRWKRDGDVHLRAGLRCTDCHRNSLNHAITRGYPGEGTEREDVSITQMSCRGCHLGQNEKGAAVAAGGRLGAPVPAHKGLPPVHLEKLTCTACHSGLVPTTQPVRVQTAMAHGLGIASQERGEDDPPAIVEPVFLRQGEGPIGVYRVMWIRDAASGQKPYAWAVGHDVRPAAQALGAKACTECHAADSAFLAGKVVPVGPGVKGEAAPMRAWMGLSESRAAALVVGYPLRPYVKVVGVVSAGAIGVVLVVYGLRFAAWGLGRGWRAGR